jgi:hypothetical protein
MKESSVIERMATRTTAVHGRSWGPALPADADQQRENALRSRIRRLLTPARFTIATYANRFGDYSGEQFQVSWGGRTLDQVLAGLPAPQDRQDPGGVVAESIGPERAVGDAVEIKDFVTNGGTLIIDSAGGNAQFAQSVDAEMEAMIPVMRGECGACLSSRRT